MRTPPLLPPHFRCAVPAVVALLFLLAPCGASAADRGVASGVYGARLLIGFDPVTRNVTGFFSDQTGQGQFSCIFYLTGRLRGPEAPLSTYFPATPRDDLIEGRLTIVSHSEVRVRLAAEHGGCWNVQHFADDRQPAQFNLDAAYPWTSVAVVKRDRAYLYDTPTARTPRKAYVVKTDGVGVRETRPGWLHIDFIGGGKPVSGWIRQSDVYPAR